MLQMGDMKVGLQLFTLREHMKTPDDIKQTMAKVAGAGYQYVEVCMPDVMPPEELAGVLKENGLTAMSTHVAEAKIKDDMDGMIARQKALSCNDIIVPSIPKELRGDLDTMLQVVTNITKYVEPLRKHGINIHYHNHTFEFAYFEQGTPMDLMCDILKQGDAYFEPDLYWAQASGINPEKWVSSITAKVDRVHVKDMRGTPQNSCEMYPIGFGNMDWPGILRACKERDVEYVVVELDSTPWDVFKSIAQSHEYLTNLIKKL